MSNPYKEKLYFLVQLQTDGRYDDKMLALTDMVGGRMWSLDGIMDAEAFSLSRPQVEQLLLKSTVTATPGAIELRIAGAEPDLIVVPKKQYMDLVQAAENYNKWMRDMKVVGKTSDGSNPTHGPVPAQRTA